jgi:hypothetical protein
LSLSITGSTENRLSAGISAEKALPAAPLKDNEKSMKHLYVRIYVLMTMNSQLLLWKGFYADIPALFTDKYPFLTDDKNNRV